MAIEKLIYPLKMVIFHSYVSLPEGIGLDSAHENVTCSIYHQQKHL